MKGLRNWLLFLLLVFIWGSNWFFMKMGLNYVGPLNFVLHRFIIASLALFPLLIFLRKKIPREREILLKLLLLAVIVAVQSIFTNVGLVYEETGISAILTYTQPLFVFCLAVPFLGEKIRLSKILGVAVGFSGVVVLSLENSSTFESFSYSSLILITGAFLWAVSIVYYKKYLSQVDPVVTNMVQMVVGAILLAPLTSSLEGLVFPFVEPYMLAILYASISSSCIGLTLWFFLLKEEDATVLASSSFAVPMIALFFGWILLKESVELSSILGFGLVVAGIYLVNKRRF